LTRRRVDGRGETTRRRGKRKRRRKRRREGRDDEEKQEGRKQREEDDAEKGEMTTMRGDDTTTTKGETMRHPDTPTIPIAQNSATGTPQQSSRAAGGSAHPFSFFLIIFHVPRHNPKGGLIPPLGIYILSLKIYVRSP
jgi:hypothetical protein